MTDYSIIDEAIELLKRHDESCSLDNGIHGLISGGDSESMTKWYNDMEAARTSGQRANEITQKLCWDGYAKVRKEAIKIIQKAQTMKTYPLFAIADYDGVWDTFKAPNKEMARKFLQIKNNSVRWGQDIIKTSDIKPELEEIRFV